MGKVFINPNLHVILIHYPLALFGMGLLIEIFSFLYRRSTLQAAGRWMILIGALATIPAAYSGIYALNDVALRSQAEGHKTVNAKWKQVAAGALLHDGNTPVSPNHLASAPAMVSASDTSTIWAMFSRHAWLQGAASGLVALTAVFALGSSDRIRRRLYPVYMLSFLCGIAMMSWGAWAAGEAVYQYGSATRLAGALPPSNLVIPPSTVSVAPAPTVLIISPAATAASAASTNAAIPASAALAAAPRGEDTSLPGIPTVLSPSFHVSPTLLVVTPTADPTTEPAAGTTGSAPATEPAPTPSPAPSPAPADASAPAPVTAPSTPDQAPPAAAPPTTAETPATAPATPVTPPAAETPSTPAPLPATPTPATMPAEFVPSATPPTEPHTDTVPAAPANPPLTVTTPATPAATPSETRLEDIVDDEPKIGSLAYFVGPPLQLHVIIAGLAVAISLGAFGATLRRFSILAQLAPKPETPAGEGASETSAEMPLDANVDPEFQQQQAMDDALAATYAPGRRPTTTQDIDLVKTINPGMSVVPAAPANPRGFPAARLWLLTFVVALGASALGVYFLATSLQSPKEPLTANLVWQAVVQNNQNPDGPGTRRLAHVIAGGLIVLLPLVLAGIARWGRSRLILTLIGFILALAIAAQVWIGILLLYDTNVGKVTQFNSGSETSHVASAEWNHAETR